MLKRSARYLFFLVLLAALPVLALDFHDWRTDGQHVQLTSVGQQSSNQAFNIYDSLLDAGFGNFALFWVGEKQSNGGNSYLPSALYGFYGDKPPTAAIKDNRPQEDEVTWQTWPPVTGKATPPARPTFTPNVPQAWGPVVVDLDSGLNSPDHFLVDVSFEQPQISGMTTTREQVLNGYYTMTGAGLPGNDPNSTSPADTGTVRPYWLRGGAQNVPPAAGYGNQQTPGLLIRSLAPIANSQNSTQPGVGVVTQPLIFSRVPAVYSDGSGGTNTEILPVVYLVVGTGENSDFATVICVSLKQPHASKLQQQNNLYIPDPTNAINPAKYGYTAPPPDPSMFDPTTGTGGCVLWSYQVPSRLGSSTPVPVAGISYANIGDSNNSRPVLFVTTADGQLIALNAKGADIQGIASDGDPVAGAPIWSFSTSPVTPLSTGMLETPGFSYGMAPAACRVPLNSLFGDDQASANRNAAAANTVTNAISTYNVSEWMVFVADTMGNFYGFEAPGAPQYMMVGGQPKLTSFAPQLRWEDIPPNGDFRHDLRSTAMTAIRERFITPPVVYQGNTPLKTSNGSLVAGTTDIGLDDEVLFSSERGRVYCLDAVGKLHVGGVNDGQPEFLAVNNAATESGTGERWVWPDSDRPFDPEGAGLAKNVEPRVWPRTLPNVNANYPDPNTTTDDIDNATLLQRNLGSGITVDGTYYSRSPMAVGLGANTNPNGGNPNLDVGDDSIYVPYMTRGTGTWTGYSGYYEYVGSIKPYGFIQLSKPIQSLDPANPPVAHIGGNSYVMPINHLRIGNIKANGLPSNQSQNILDPVTAASTGPNPYYVAGATAQDDTIYVVKNFWYDGTSKTWVTLPMDGSATITVNYTAEAPPNTNNAVPGQTETIPFPSCYRQANADPDDVYAPFAAANPAQGPLDPQVTRGLASLSEANQRLEQQQYVLDTTAMPANRYVVTDENVANVPDTLFDTYDWRPGAMMATGSSSSQGNLMVPSWFRGRIIAMSQTLRIQRTISSNFDPRLDPATATTFGQPRPNGADAGHAGKTYYGPPAPAAATDDLLNTVDPGALYTPPVYNGASSDPDYSANQKVFLDDEPAITRAGASTSLDDGWMYVVYRNGYLAAYSNAGGGASGTQYYPPYFYPPQQTTSGTLVRAPGALEGSGIFLTSDPANPTDRTKYIGVTYNGTTFSVDPTAGDKPFLLEAGQTLYWVVDFGASNELAPPGKADPNKAPTPGGGNDDLDSNVLQYEVQGQIRSSNGAVQQLPGINRGAKPQIINNRVVAVVPMFAGVPSATNPLTPGTPLLWEKKATDPNQYNTFTGELTYDVQITQQGLQWRWPGNYGNTDTTKQHYWEIERNNGATRFPTTAGTSGTTPVWQWFNTGVMNEWAPLVSYNNPIGVWYNPSGVNNAGAQLNSNVFGMIDGSGNGVNQVGTTVTYTGRNDPGRRNGDQYITTTVDGSRSGSGTPIVPVLGAPLDKTSGQLIQKQALFADHGRTSGYATTVYPELAVLRLVDRSLIATLDPNLQPLGGRSLQLRVKPAALTKLGVGADIGTQSDTQLQKDNLDPTITGVSRGSFQQNFNVLDDGPDQLYPSIPAARTIVTKLGSGLDLTQGPVQIVGRNKNGTLPTANNFDAVAVQVDIPPFTGDDIYSTRWRSTVSNWNNTGRSGAPPDAIFNPFYPSPGTFNFGSGTLQTQKLFDRAERLSQPPSNITNQESTALTTRGEDQTPPPSATSTYNPNYDDRFRRIIVFNDANGNGQLDLLPTYREAYRTFLVQVAVRPDLKLQASQAVADVGNEWHGKKQPGTGSGVQDIREWQQMAAMSASSSPATLQSIAAFYKQYWRQFNLLNTGNVNLAYIKPEVAYQIAGKTGAQFIAFPSPGNDPWRALSLISPPSLGSSASLEDPYQIFLRTSFDDQLLPTSSAPYGAGGRGIWLQKAILGSGQPGAVAYADPSATPSGTSAGRDPSLTGTPRETWLSLNVPNGAPLGTYSGTLRFYNDRSVTQVDDPAVLQFLGINPPAGYAYVRPEQLAGVNAAMQFNGTLDRDPGTVSGHSLGAALEPSTDPPLQMKVRVTENLIHGRYTNNGGNLTQDPADRRTMPAAMPDASASSTPGQVNRLLLTYISNRNGLAANATSTYDVFAARLDLDNSLGRGLFPFDELPLDRPPWMDLPAAGYGWTALTNLVAGTQASKPVMAQDANGVGLVAWTQRTTITPGNNQYHIFYEAVTPLGSGSSVLEMLPGGNPLNGIPRGNVNLTTAANNSGATAWFATYATGSGAERTLTYTWTGTPGTASSWSTEYPLPTSRSLTTIDNPRAITTGATTRAPAALSGYAGEPAYLQPEDTTIPAMDWVAYQGTNQATSRTDVYLSRYRLAALTANVVAGQQSPLSTSFDNGRVSFPRMEKDILTADQNRLVYRARGIDWLIPGKPISGTPTVGPGPVQAYLARTEVSAGNSGSYSNPIPLIDLNVTAQIAANGEYVFQLAAALRSLSPILASTKVVVDPQAGTVRFTTDTRTIARLAITNPAMTAQSPDPIILADYTPATLRLTRGDVSGTTPVIVPVISQPGQPIMDASWYRQQIDGTKWSQGIAVAGQADRLWLLWRRAAGAVSGGPACYYKVFRPGVRVSAGAIYGIQPAQLQVTVGGNAVTPEEVNPATGTIYFPATFEGQRVAVSYVNAQGNTIQESPIVTWQEESGEQPVPMETSVNEGTLDAFASYETAQMSDFNGSVNGFNKLERIWLFWGSTRGTGGDIFYAALAPRIGPEANVSGSVVYSSISGAALSLLSPNAARTAITNVRNYEKLFPFTAPRDYRKGPYILNRANARNNNRAINR